MSSHLKTLEAVRFGTVPNGNVGSVKLVNPSGAIIVQKFLSSVSSGKVFLVSMRLFRLRLNPEGAVHVKSLPMSMLKSAGVVPTEILINESRLTVAEAVRFLAAINEICPEELRTKPLSIYGIPSMAPVGSHTVNVIVDAVVTKADGIAKSIRPSPPRSP